MTTKTGAQLGKSDPHRSAMPPFPGSFRFRKRLGFVGRFAASKTALGEIICAHGPAETCFRCIFLRFAQEEIADREIRSNFEHGGVDFLVAGKIGRRALSFAFGSLERESRLHAA